MKLRGEPVIVRRCVRSYDENKDPVETWSEERVDNVLFGRPTAEQIEESARLYGVTISFSLGVPKAYTALLRDCEVQRVRTGITYRVVEDPPAHPNELCPTAWNRATLVVVCDG